MQIGCNDVSMTLVVGVIDPEQDAVYLSADSKVSWMQDAARSRQIYMAPALKVIRLDGDLAVGLAGDGPATLAARIEALRGGSIDTVLAGLAEIAGGEFVVASRAPARLWQVTPETGPEDRTSIGRAWAGDKGAFSAFQARFDDLPGDPIVSRLHSAMSHIIHLRRPEFVGGFAVTVAGSARREFHYLPTRSELWPEAEEAVQVADVTMNADGTMNFKLRASFNEGPLVLHVVPGADPTCGAVALWIENAHLGFLFCHESSATRHQVRSATLDESA